MFLSRTSVLVLTVSLLGGGVALAQDESSDAEQGEAGTEEKKVEEYVEGQVEEENEQDDEARGADPGEASYNVSDCAPEGEGGSEESAGSDPEAIEECEQMVK